MLFRSINYFYISRDARSADRISLSLSQFPRCPAPNRSLETTYVSTPQHMWFFATSCHSPVSPTRDFLLRFSGVRQTSQLQTCFRDQSLCAHNESVNAVRTTLFRRVSDGGTTPPPIQPLSLFCLFPQSRKVRKFNSHPSFLFFSCASVL